VAKVLVVDDEGDIRSMVETALSVAGHEVTTATNGREALRTLKRRTFDAIVLDIMMPEMDGYEVLDQLRERGREDIPVIVITAKHDPDGLKREVLAGATDHLAKPFFPSELEAAVERATDHDQLAAARLRRRILGTDADIYGALNGLVASARASQNI
jgi:CheY-like chemotaxis protein